MRATIPYIEKKFEEFNKQIFAGKLPKLPIELSNAKTFLGVCVYEKRKLPNGEIEKINFKLRINTRIDLEENIIEDTIIHEMIHYFIGINKLEDSSTHGPVFLHIMNNINEKFGRNLSVSHKASNDEREQLYDTSRRWHVVAVCSFKNGKVGIKVLPRVQPKIIDFCQKLALEKSIESYQLYLTDEPFFNRFPTSTALRIAYVDKEDIIKYLVSAQKLKILDDNIK